MAYLKRPQAGDADDLIMSDYTKTYKISSDSKAKAWAQYMKDINGWSYDQTFNSIGNYGYSQLEDFFSDNERTIEAFFTQSVGKYVGQFQNFANALGAADVTEADVEEARQLQAANIEGAIGNMKTWSEWAEAGVLSVQGIDAINDLAKQALEIAPDLNFDFVPGGTDVGALTAKDYVAQVSGFADDTPSLSKEAAIEPQRENYPIGADGTREWALALRDYRAEQEEGGETGLEEGYPVRSQFPEGAEGHAEYTRALNEFLGRGPEVTIDDDGSVDVGDGDDGGDGGDGGDTGDGDTEDGGDYGLENTFDKQAALDFLTAEWEAGRISSEWYYYYSDVVEAWDPNLELNIENLTATLEEVRTKSIDPYYQGLTDLAKAQVTASGLAIETQRTDELRSEELAKQEAIRGTRAGLESSGLTFTGEGVRQLGSQSAFAETGAVPFGGVAGVSGMTGLVPESHDLIATSSAARYAQNVSNLGLAAEAQLGSDAMAGLVTGYDPVTGVFGAIPEAKEAEIETQFGNILTGAQANALSTQNLTFTS